MRDDFSVTTSEFSKAASDLYGRIVDRICDKAHEITAQRTPVGKERVVSRVDVLKALQSVAQIYEPSHPPRRRSEE